MKRKDLALLFLGGLGWGLFFGVSLGSRAEARTTTRAPHSVQAQHPAFGGLTLTAMDQMTARRMEGCACHTPPPTTR